jgi:hypothetical protein
MKTKEQIARIVDNFWLGLGDISQYDNIEGPFDGGLFSDPDGPPDKLLEAMLNPEYLSFVCKHFLATEILPFQAAILHEMWIRPFPMLIGSRGLSKSFLLSVYALLRALLTQGCKVVIVGAAFRQSKVLFEYMVDIWNRAELLRDICGTSREQGPRIDVDRCTMTIGKSKIIAIPLGNGDKIRGLRANYIICDEFSSVPRQIYETVVGGFAVVSASPVENVKRAGREMGKKHLKIWDECLKDEVTMGNQAILSGTAFYAFNHFAEYWLNYRNIILSRGEPNKLYEIFKGPPHENFNWKDYSIIRIPYDKLPPGLMEEKHIIRAKANIHTGAFLCEYCAVFATDSNGFFKRTLIEACVTSDANMENMPDGVIKFPAAIRGNKKRKYIYGVDPASESDNFTIVIIELHANHSRIVYTWTTKKAKHREVINKGLTEEKDFYRYCGRKIRDLMKSFPCERIMMDSQGGGYAVYEVLQDDKNLQDGEKPIYEIIVDGDEKESDDKPGLHILELVNFADAKWTSAANHGMKKDFEDKALLFPEFDPIIIGEAIMDDKATNRIFDTLEDAYMEIEELKNELTTIVHTQTGAQGRDKWDTPEVKMEGGRKGRQHKDRYSALLMANMGARMLARVPEQVEYNHLGGFANQITKGADGKKCTGPDWFSGSAYNNM